MSVGRKDKIWRLWLFYQKVLYLLLEPTDEGLICGTVKPSSNHLLLALMFVASLNPTCPVAAATCGGHRGGPAGACGTHIPKLISGEKLSRSPSRNGNTPSPPLWNQHV